LVQFVFNAADVRPNAGGQDVIPSGVYRVQITRTEMKPTKDGSGAYLEVGMSVIDGDHKGATVVDRLNLKNQNAKAVEIAYGSLSAICHVTGVLAMQDTQQLHGRPFQVKVLCSPRQDDPSKQGNEVKGYYDANGNEPGAVAAPAAPPAPVAPAAPAAAPVAAPVAPAAPAAAPVAAPVAPAAPAAAPAPAAPPVAAPAVAPAPAAPAAPPWAQQA
jgi:hypothetical protein